MEKYIKKPDKIFLFLRILVAVLIIIFIGLIFNIRNILFEGDRIDSLNYRIILIAILLYLVFLSLIITRQIILKFKNYLPVFTWQSKIFARIWRGSLFPIFGQLILITNMGIAISNGFVFNHPAKNKLSNALRKIYTGGHDDIWIDIKSVQHVTIKILSSDKYKVIFQVVGIKPIQFIYNSNPDMLKKFCEENNLSFSYK